MHVGGDTVEINTEAAGSDITVYTLTNDKPSAGMFGFLYCYVVCINLILLHVCNAVTFYSCSSFYFLTPSSQVPGQNSAEHWYMFGSDPDFKMFGKYTVSQKKHPQRF